MRDFTEAQSGEIMRATFSFDSKLVIHQRKSYGFLEFLGDAGGIYESVYIIGSVLHVLLSSNSLAIKILENHFKVAPNQDNNV